MKRLLIVAAVLGSLMLASSAQAFELLQPNSAGNARIEAGQSVDDTVITAGQSVDIRGPITKDLFAAGSSVSIDSPIGGNVVAVGATLTVNSAISGGLIVAGGTVKIEKDATVAGDVMVFGGTVEVLGTITGDLQVFAGAVSLSGTITGDVKVQTDKMTLADTATVGGSLTGTLGTALDDTAASHVTGTIDVTVGQSSGKPYNTAGAATGLGIATGMLTALYSLLSLLVTGLALILLTPKFLDLFRKRSHSEPLTSGLIGLSLLVGGPIVFVLCLVFFITIPLGLLEVGILTLVGLLGSVAANLWVGDLIGSHQWSPLLTLAVGAIIVALVGLIPVVGMLLQFVAWLVGVGSVGYVLYQHVAAPKGK